MYRYFKARMKMKRRLSREHLKQMMETKLRAQTVPSKKKYNRKKEKKKNFYKE